MKQTEELFQLIRSLGKHEKRFFKLFASIEEGDHIYMTIFDLIDKQKKYDEEAIVKQLGIQKNVFAVQKHYLFNLLLSRIAILHSSKESELRMLLTQADILYKKGLYPSCEKLLNKAKARATHLDMYGMLLEVLRMQHLNAWRKPDLNEAGRIIEEEKKVLELQYNQKRYTHLANEIITLLSLSGDTRNKKVAARLAVLMKDPLITDENNALTFHSRYTRLHTIFTYHFIHGDLKQQYHFAKKASALYEAHPEKIKHTPLQHIYSLHNLMNTCNALKKYDESKIYLDKLRSTASLLSNEREKVWAFFTYHDGNIGLYVKTGRFEEAVEVAESLLKELKQTELY